MVKIVYISQSHITSSSANSVHVMKMCEALAFNSHSVTLVGIRGDINVDPFTYYATNKNFDLRLLKLLKFYTFD